MANEQSHEPKVGLVEGIVVTMVIMLYEFTIGLIPAVNSILNLPISGALLGYLYMRGLPFGPDIVTGVAEFFPAINEFPLLTVGWLITMYLDHHPKIAAVTSVTSIAKGKLGSNVNNAESTREGVVAARGASAGGGAASSASAAGAVGGAGEIGEDVQYAAAERPSVGTGNKTRRAAAEERPSITSEFPDDNPQDEELDPALFGEKPPIHEQVKQELFDPDYENEEDEDENVTMDDNGTVDLSR